MRRMWMSGLSRQVMAAVLIAAVPAFSLTAVAQEAAGDEPMMLATGEFTTPDAEGAKVMTFFVEFAPGAKIPLHHHGGSGLVMFLSGEIAITSLDGTVQTFRAGDSFIEEANDSHSGEVGGSEPARLIWTIVLPDGAELETMD